MTNLKSWLEVMGDPPETFDEPSVPVDLLTLLSADDWRDLAERWGDMAIIAICGGAADDAYGYARGAARFCLEYERSKPDAE